MEKFQTLLQTKWFIFTLQIFLCVVLSVCMLIFPKKFVPNWSPLEVTLMDIFFIISAGVMFALCFLLKKPHFSAKDIVLWFVVGAVGFAAVYFALTVVLNKACGSEVACYVGLALVAAFQLACVICQDVLCFRRGYNGFFVMIAFITLISFAASIFFSNEVRTKGWLFRLFSEDEIVFETASYEELVVTDADRKNNRNWYEKYIVGAVKEGRRPGFDFALGGKKLSDTLSDWTQSDGENYEYADGQGTEIILTNQKEKAQATVKAVWYEKTATFEWTVYLKNIGDKVSTVVSSFYPLDTTFDYKDAYLYYSNGSDFKNDDFALLRHKVPSRTVTMDTINGRTSQRNLPFFNVSGKQGGFTVGIGWSGEWKADFTNKNGTQVTVGQKSLEGYLAPGEEIRSPLVSLSLYEGSNPLKGFNTFRQRIKDSLPKEYGNMRTFAFAGAEGEANMKFVGEEGVKKLIGVFEEQGQLDTVDYAWFDAGWFDVEGKGNWGSTSGDWEIDTRRYPNGLKTVSDYLDEKGIGFLLWYEPERIPDRSKIFQTGKAHQNWLLSLKKISSGDYNNYLWNMGDEEANAYMCKHIGDSIEENGVDFYRQDFNIDPGAYWEKADKEIYDGRKGFCENKYVVGEYKFLDYLKERFPSLLIDNCASGGRRIDLEMCRRSVPLWRSDYNCFDYPDLEEASQYQTYGLSLWLPLSNCGDDWTAGEYDYRSCLGPIVECYPSFLTADPAGYKKYMEEYDKIKGYFLQNYYPLTPCTMSDKITVALQFGDEKEGTIIVFARNKTEVGEKTFKMNGLKEGARYTIKTVEGEDVAKRSGKELLTDGFGFKTERRTACILVYKEEQK